MALVSTVAFAVLTTSGKGQRIPYLDYTVARFRTFPARSGIRWSTIQHGSLINDVCPIRSHENAKRSSGYSSRFGFHTEDAFHPFQEHFLMLLCVRNMERAATKLVSVDDLSLSPHTRAVLSQNRFIFRANQTHESRPVFHSAQNFPILFGNWNKPFLRLNVNQLMSHPDDEEARQAIEELGQVMERCGVDLVLEPGDVLLIDNYRVAHARDVYTPETNAQGRWLKRIYVTADHRCLGSAWNPDEPHVANG